MIRLFAAIKEVPNDGGHGVVVPHYSTQTRNWNRGLAVALAVACAVTLLLIVLDAPAAVAGAAGEGGYYVALVAAVKELRQQFLSLQFKTVLLQVGRGNLLAELADAAAQPMLLWSCSLLFQQKLPATAAFTVVSCLLYFVMARKR
ncbi:MAG TPA: hypothetical protein VHA30_01915 [Patescibacteria group bacterium]|nr:hypothetical protein [Patescibacteria group bacterium]